MAAKATKALKSPFAYLWSFLPAQKANFWWAVIFTSLCLSQAFQKSLVTFYVTCRDNFRSGTCNSEMLGGGVPMAPGLA